MASVSTSPSVSEDQATYLDPWSPVGDAALGYGSFRRWGLVGSTSLGSDFEGW